MKKFRLLLAAFAASTLLAVPVAAYAHDGPHSGTSDDSLEHARIETEKKMKKAELEKRIANKKAEFEKMRQEAKAKIMTKQDEAKKMICEKRAESFKKRMGDISERSEKRAEGFNKIAERVKMFAAEKKVTVPDYDQLLADVEAKDQALKQAHDLVKQNAATFECNGDSARAGAAIFKQALQDEQQAFKDYREAIKNLIKAVKQAVQTTKSGENNE